MSDRGGGPADPPAECVAVSRLGGVDLVRLSGEIDMANADGVEREILEQTAAAGAVVIDLTAVTFLDSAGVRALDRLVATFEERGARVRLVVPARGPVRLTLTICAFRDDLLATGLAEATGELAG